MTLRDTTKEIQRIVGVHVDGVYGPQTARAILGKLQGKTTNQIVSIPEFDDRTQRNLNTLNPKAKKKIIPFVRKAIGIGASMGVEVKVICGFRNKKDQEDAKRRGVSKAGWGFSWHNYGIAIDFGVFKGRTYIDSADPDLAWMVYSAIGQIASEHDMEWGGSWTSFKDTPHFHLNLGRSSPNKNDRKLFFEGRWTF